MGGTMKKYQVDLVYTGYVSVEIEAETEEEAIEKVEAMGTAGMGNIERWPEADMVEEITDYEEADIDNNDDEKPAQRPEEGDFIISPFGPMGSKTKVSIVGSTYIVLGEEDQEPLAYDYIRNRMKQENFYPNVWTMSDHGNLTLTTIEGEVQ
jgi:hypothetical protein